MSIGNSGRVVVEIDPNLKKELYATLMREGLTLKDWFVKSAETYLTSTYQQTLSFDKRQEKETDNEATQ
jgi:hypothetical protein